MEWTEDNNLLVYTRVSSYLKNRITSADMIDVEELAELSIQKSTYASFPEAHKNISVRFGINKTPQKILDVLKKKFIISGIFE